MKLYFAPKPGRLAAGHPARNRKENALVKRTIPLLAALAAGLLATGTGRTGDVKPIADSDFARLHQMIRVQPDEQRFWQIPWKLTISEAREQAAREGKPIFVWAGAGGAPIGVC
jgi:hypothetical protein